jgi:hypothetical protein
VVANAFGAQIPLHGYTLWHQRFVFLSSALFASVRRCSGHGSRAACSAGHAMDAFACAAFLAYWAGTVGRSDRRRWIVLGLLLGVATLVRAQELAMGVVVALEVVIETVRRLVFGSVTELPQGAKYTRLEAPMVAELLFAPRNGWFSTTPIGGLEPYLVRGWSHAVTGTRALRWTTAAEATVLVPNLMPYGQRLTLWLAPAGARHATVLELAFLPPDPAR